MSSHTLHASQHATSQQIINNQNMFTRIDLIIATTGKAYEIDLGVNDTFVDVQHVFEQCAQIHAADQIILDAHGNRIDKQLPTQTHPDQPVVLYLFSRHSFVSPVPLRDGNMEKVVQQAWSEMNIQLPPYSNPPISHPLYSVSPQLLRFDTLFTCRLVEVETYMQHFDHVQRKYILTYIQAQKGQIHSVHVATLNLNAHLTGLKEKWSQFQLSFDTYMSEYQHTLSSIDEDIARLQAITLHTLLQNSTRHTLYDALSSTKLIKRKEGTLKDTPMFQSKFTQESQLILSLENKIQEMQQPMTFDDINKLESIQHEWNNKAEEMLHWWQKLKGDIDYVRAQINEVRVRMERGEATEQFIQQLCTACDKISEVHLKEMLPLFSKSNEELQNIVQNTFFSYTKTQTTCHSRLHSIHNCSNELRDSFRTFTLLSQSFQRLYGQFKPLTHIKLLPQFYQATLFEVSRRNSFHALFQSEFNSIQQRLKSLTQDELKKRDLFDKEFGHILPSGLIPGLQDRPSVTNIQFNEFDSQLPPIDANTLVDLIPLNSSHINFPSLPSVNNTLAPPLVTGNPIASSTQYSWLKTPNLFNLHPDIVSYVRRLESENQYLKAAQVLQQQSASKSSDIPPAVDDNTKQILANIAEAETRIKELQELREKVQQLESELAAARSIVSTSTAASSAVSNTEFDELRRQLKLKEDMLAEHHANADKLLKETQRENEENAMGAARHLQLLKAEKEQTSKLQQQLDTMERDMKQQNTQLVDDRDAWRDMAYNSLCYVHAPTSQDLVRFDLNSHQQYTVFHAKSRHYYLSVESQHAWLNELRQQHAARGDGSAFEQPTWMIGEVVHIVRMVATETNNPYHMEIDKNNADNNKFYVLTAQYIEPSKLPRLPNNMHFD